MHNSLDIRDRQLAEKIRGQRELVETTHLTTDQRVIARVTDGIYRQPGSALRELISNAYDADASKVIIRTDEPRFKTMYIEDNGHGMSPESLSYVLHHIGGSSKRNETGAALGVTSNDNFNASPNGRQLIGKIGIGLFSVAQLTQNFQIITKQKNDDFRTIATVALKQYSEKKNNESDEYETGVVKIWTEKASDIESHGTTIILNKIRPQTRETLTSKQIWDSVEISKLESEDNGSIPMEPPKYHIGKVTNDETLKDLGDYKYTSVPWSKEDSSKSAFLKLVKSIWNEVNISNPKPKLTDLFDYYLKMVWDISLSIPTTYIEGDLFDIPFNEQFYTYKISNSPKGQASPLDLKTGETLNEALGIEKKPADKFEVFIDELKLFRPIIFENLPISNNSVKKPMVFIGYYKESFEGRSVDITGGPLEFKAYLFWNSKIAPVEHQGSLIRIHNASGTLFDETFLKYQVQEVTRKNQVTCEIFVEQGLDSALNIDRESFNFSHPHVVILTRWLHSAFRQLTNTNKIFASKIRENNRENKTEAVKSQINNIIDRAWINSGNDTNQAPPKVAVVGNDFSLNQPNEKEDKKSIDYIIDFTKSENYSSLKNDGAKRNTNKNNLTEEKIKAITSILASYGALDNVAPQKLNEMIFSIYEIINAED